MFIFEKKQQQKEKYVASKNPYVNNLLKAGVFFIVLKGLAKVALKLNLKYL